MRKKTTAKLPPNRTESHLHLGSASSHKRILYLKYTCIPIYRQNDEVKCGRDDTVRYNARDDGVSVCILCATRMARYTLLKLTAHSIHTRSCSLCMWLPWQHRPLRCDVYETLPCIYTLPLSFSLPLLRVVHPSFSLACQIPRIRYMPRDRFKALFVILLTLFLGSTS